MYIIAIRLDWVINQKKSLKYILCSSRTYISQKIVIKIVNVTKQRTDQLHLFIS